MHAVHQLARSVPIFPLCMDAVETEGAARARATPSRPQIRPSKRVKAASILPPRVSRTGRHFQRKRLGFQAWLTFTFEKGKYIQSVV